MLRRARESRLDVSNEQMASRILSGDPAGLNVLLGRYGHDLAEYVRVFTLEDTDKFRTVFEDVVVTVLRRIRLAADQYNGSFRRFVFECAARTIRRRHPELLQAPSNGQRTGRAAVRDLARIGNPTAEQLREAAASLVPDERELLALRHRFGFSYDEISDIRSEARVNFEDRMGVAREHFRARLLTLVTGKPVKSDTDMIAGGAA